MNLSLPQDKFGINELVEILRVPIEFQKWGLMNSPDGFGVRYPAPLDKDQTQQKVWTGLTTEWVGAAPYYPLPYGIQNFPDILPEAQIVWIGFEDYDVWIADALGIPALANDPQEVNPATSLWDLPTIPAKSRVLIPVDAPEPWLETLIAKLQSSGWHGQMAEIDLAPMDPENLWQKADPVDLSEFMPAPPDHRLLFPEDIFPASIEQFINVAAESLSSPRDLVAVPVLAALSILIGSSVKFQTKELDEYDESANLYLGTCAPPGSTKTPAMQMALKPIYKISAEFEADWAEKDQSRKKAENSGAENPLLANLPPRPPTLWASSPTVEALAVGLRDNPHGMLLISDELGGWIGSLNAYKGGRGDDRQFFLRAWSGGAINMARKSAESVRVSNPFLSLIGTITPDGLAAITNRQIGEDGLLERLLIAYPSVPPTKWTHSHENLKIRQNYEIFCRALWVRMQSAALAEETPAQPNTITWANDGAENVFATWHDTMRQQTASGVLAGFMAKLPGHALRFMLILAVANGETQVTVKTVEKAMLLAQYFLNHAKFVHKAAVGSTADKTLLRFVDKIAQHGGSITIREIQQNKFFRDRKADEIRKQLEAWETAGQITIDRTGKNWVIMAKEAKEADPV